MTKYSLGALVAAGVLAGGFATSASAADLGGNCCADLEERIAELEATTARKGNRKVSLTISGWVAQQVMWWDDGQESNTYITDTGSVSIGTHVKFSGQATIVPGWTAGYVLNIEAIQNDSLLVDQNFDNGISGNAMAVIANGSSLSNGLGANNSALAVESSFWFVKSDHLGKLSVGKQSSAADNQAILPDGSGTLVVANYVQYDNNAFFLRLNNGTLTGMRRGTTLASCATLDGGGGVSGDCDGYPSNQIRYDSPVFGGFSGSWSWGEDDTWSLSGRYAGEWSGFKVAGAIAYNESADENGPGQLLNAHLDVNTSAFQIGAYVEHVATGLFLYGAYSQEYIDDLTLVTGDASGKPEGHIWYIKAGLRSHCVPLGHTIFYGEYGESDDRMDASTFLDLGIDSTSQRQYGVGVVQEIDAAAMSVWLAWRHYESDADCAAARGTCATGAGAAGALAVGHNDFDNFDLVKGGALINF